ncbi:MAG: hypothetical protein HZB91_04440 [Elusimicrobia bacterium]|nr:hypothetical protein [Elusimicrobiota bacterium]
MIRLVSLIAFCSLSIAFGPAFVNAAAKPDAAKQSKKPGKKSQGLTLTEFINKVLTEGDDNDFLPATAQVLGLEPGHKTKAFEKLEDKCADKRYRTVDVVVEKVPGSNQLKPACVILLAKRTLPGAAEHEWFRLKPDGSIEKAYRTTGKLTADGHGVPGSAVDMDFDPDEAKALLKRELDFWLKGIGLKKQPAAQAPSKP